MKRLVLFDIDGTLVLDDGAAREAFAEGLAEVYGYEGDLGVFNFSGKTDPQIAFEVLEHGGYPADSIADGLERLWPIYVSSLQGRLHKGRQRVLPGVRELLDRLVEIPEVTLGVLSGNIEAGAKVKLAPWDLGRYFGLGAFGSDSRHRAELPLVAARRATELTGLRFAPREVVIIGDSIWDVRCGVPHDSVTIAVASGWTTASTLREENPDFLFESMVETDAWVEAICS
ncbi:MAG: haloacid dehalogenase-like hydrolase [Acidobacteria bacterium]|nr:haloacid dehalogenase-like hydrolase [Acidobacteriota bacterium]